MHDLAQLNIAVMKAPLESPAMTDFVAGLDRINALAEGSPGFVWRLKDDAGNATAIRPFGDDTLVNLSVWRSVAALEHYVYRTAHVEFVRRRKEWFDKMAETHMVLWWVPQGERPTLTQAAERLALLRAQGPSSEAFNFRLAFPPPGPLPAAA